MTTRRCTSCGEDKPLDDYYNAKAGLHGKYSKCKRCCIKKSRKRQIARRKWFVAKYEDRLVCVECGDSRLPVLDFHHKDPNEKEHSMSHIIRNGSKETVKKEMKKCVVLCSNCHRMHHWNERNS